MTTGKGALEGYHGVLLERPVILRARVVLVEHRGILRVVLVEQHGRKTATIRRLVMGCVHNGVGDGVGDPMGGAISASGGTMSITSSEFTDNRAAKGGAIYTSGILTIVAAAFSGNKATVTASGHGGGAIVINGGTLSVTLSTFSNNQASGSSGTAFGGAIASISGGTVTITTTKFSGNRASGIHGGGGGAIYCGGGTLKLTNTTLSNNQAVAGLAIFAQDGASVELSNITVHPISQNGLYCNQKSTSLSSSSAVTTKTPMSCS